VDDFDPLFLNIEVCVQDIGGSRSLGITDCHQKSGKYTPLGEIVIFLFCLPSQKEDFLFWGEKD
jgi:hypothetical protein